MSDHTNSTQNESTQNDAQQTAEACANVLWREDKVAQNLNIEIISVGPGEAKIKMPVTGTMENGHGIAHGGYLFTLADTAFAYACNAYNQKVVAQQCSITYIAPAFTDDVLTATAKEVSRRGRSGIYDIQVNNQKGETIAEFRGNSRTIKGVVLPNGSEQA